MKRNTVYSIFIIHFRIFGHSANISKGIVLYTIKLFLQFWYQIKPQKKSFNLVPSTQNNFIN